MFRYAGVVAALLLASVLPVIGPADAAVSARRCHVDTFYSHQHLKADRYTYANADVWVYGDSITNQTWRNLRATIGFKVAVDTMSGRRALDGVRAMRLDLQTYKHRPKAVVMAEGTNDLRDLTLFRKTVKYARSVLPKSIPLLWVNILSLRTSTAGKYVYADKVLNTTPGIQPVLWAKAVGHEVGRYLDRGLHVTDAGCDLRNRLIRKAVVAATKH